MRLILIIFAVVGLAAVGLAVAAVTGVVKIPGLDFGKPRPVVVVGPGNDPAPPADPVPEESLPEPEPEPILSERTIQLLPEQATLHGGRLRVEGERQAPVNWNGDQPRDSKGRLVARGPTPKPPALIGFYEPKDRAEWNVMVSEAGRYSISITLTTGVSDKTTSYTPGEVVVAIGGKSFKTPAVRTASAFRVLDLGEVELAAGEHGLAVAPEVKQKSSTLLQIRSIRLYPMD